MFFTTEVIAGLTSLKDGDTSLIFLLADEVSILLVEGIGFLFSDVLLSFLLSHATSNIAINVKTRNLIVILIIDWILRNVYTKIKRQLLKTNQYDTNQ